MKKCEMCPNLVRDVRNKCCGWVCRNKRISKLYKGKTFTEEHKRNIAKNHHDVRGNKNPKWKGGRMNDNFGYVLVWNPQHPCCNNLGYVREHRLVMEEKVGRLLKSKEVVHHINGIKNDNRLENLQLFNSLAEHSRLHLIQRHAQS